jgi:hypothetical protein
MGLAGRATDSKAAKLGREEPPGMEATATKLIDTLGASGRGNTQSPVVKAESGGDAKANPRFRGRGPRELKMQEGTRVPDGSKPPAGDCGSPHGTTP